MLAYPCGDFRADGAFSTPRRMPIFRDGPKKMAEIFGKC